ncbi:hypothetical protein MAR_026714, partial [Mya arenaria]
METMLRMIGCSCTVTVKTSEGKRTATTGKVQITMYGTSGHTAALLLSSLDPGTLAFTSGAKSREHHGETPEKGNSRQKTPKDVLSKKGQPTDYMQGKQASNLYTIFTGLSQRAKRAIQHSGFGHIDDDE